MTCLGRARYLVTVSELQQLQIGSKRDVVVKARAARRSGQVGMGQHVLATGQDQWDPVLG